MLEVVLESKSDDFLVQVGLHQGSVFFIILLEALSKEIGSGCPEKLLCAYHLTLISETLEGLIGRLQAWKEA